MQGAIGKSCNLRQAYFYHWVFCKIDQGLGESSCSWCGRCLVCGYLLLKSFSGNFLQGYKSLEIGLLRPIHGQVFIGTKKFKSRDVKLDCFTKTITHQNNSVSLFRTHDEYTFKNQIRSIQSPAYNPDTQIAQEPQSEGFTERPARYGYFFGA